MARIDDIAKTIDNTPEESAGDAFVGLWGKPSVGKTITALKLAQELALGGPILYLDTSVNLTSVRQNPEFAGLLDNVHEKKLRDPADMAFIAAALEQRRKPFDEYAVVVVDENTSVALAIYEQNLKDLYGTPGDERIPAPPANNYGKEYTGPNAMLRSYLRALRNAPDLHVILVSHERDVSDTDAQGESRPTRRPAYWPTAFIEYSKFMQVSARMSVKIGAKLGKPEYLRSIQSWPSAKADATCKIATMPLTCTPDEWVERVADFILGPAE